MGGHDALINDGHNPAHHSWGSTVRDGCGRCFMSQVLGQQQ